MSVLTEREKKSEVMLNKILARGSNSWSLTDIHDLEEVIRLLLQDSKDFQAQLSLSTKREEIYRKALDEIAECGICQAERAAQTALDEGKEVK